MAKEFLSRDLLLRHKPAVMVPGITENLFFIIFFSLLLSTFNTTNVQGQLHVTIKTKRQSNLGLLPKGGPIY